MMQSYLPHYSWGERIREEEGRDAWGRDEKGNEEQKRPSLLSAPTWLCGIGKMHPSHSIPSQHDGTCVLVSDTVV